MSLIPNSADQTAMTISISNPARKKPTSFLDPALLRAALVDSFRKLDPRAQLRNPVMFVVEVGTVLSILFTIAAVLGHGGQASVGYLVALDVWLFLTVIFANFATALAEARGKAQADSLRKTRRETPAFRFRRYENGESRLDW